MGPSQHQLCCMQHDPGFRPSSVLSRTVMILSATVSHYDIIVLCYIYIARPSISGSTPVFASTNVIY
ncbi:hypothetical protein BDN67DRAFT_382215 [Paxillus ammoniavirescens]|nr:hypothetical protein BDN67DRAFT_382215 [Paxillus ammoniavirescens]